MSKRARAALATGVGLVTLTASYLTIPWEGVETTAYYDKIGRVWTVCAGETKGVKPGDRYTRDECLQMLETRMERDFRRPLQKCIRDFDNFPISVQAAFLDLSYNVGVGAVCSSTAKRRAEAGNWSDACEAMTWFNKAGGKVVRGLKLRREEGDAHRIGDRELCLAGLDKVVPVPRPNPIPPVEPTPTEPDRMPAWLAVVIYAAGIAAGLFAVIRIVRLRK